MRESVERHVVLVHPEIPWNTGCIGRTCIGTDTRLHLIEPLGFSLGQKEVKRAGLDYWPKVQLSVWPDFAACMASLAPNPGEVALFTKTGSRSFRKMPSLERMILVFGAEATGLPMTVLDQFPQDRYHIPINGEIRSLNLSTSVGIALFESLRGMDREHGWGE